jgi:dihydrodipicolinate synthase/N-acetylneuraminate lyase
VLTTPFTESGEVYKEGLRRLVDFQTVQEIVVDQAGGETGGYARRIQEMALLQPQALRWIWC